MKILILNGSPRKGNTVAALEALKSGFENIEDVHIREISANDAAVSPCIACEACGSESRCVFDDDTNDIVDAVMESDVIIFATPVYWWGITAQLKVIIDKFYSRSLKMHGLDKKVGVIVIGEAEQDDPQYGLITKQFGCICDYLEWKLVFSKTYTAGAAGELADSKEAMAEIGGLWKNLR